MIDETKTRIPCWLVWSTTERGTVTLEAIGLTNRYALQARTVLFSSGRFISVKIEKSECNHLFGPDLDETWWEMYGEQARKRLTEESDKIHSRAAVTEGTLMIALWRACSSLMPNLSSDVEGYDKVRKVMQDILPFLSS